MKIFFELKKQKEDLQH